MIRNKVYYIAILVLGQNFYDSVRVVPEKDFSEEWLEVNCPLHLDDSKLTFEDIYDNVVNETDLGDIDYERCALEGYYKPSGVRGSWIIMKSSIANNIKCKSQKLTISNLKLSDAERYLNYDENDNLRLEEYVFDMFDVVGDFKVYNADYDTNIWCWETRDNFFDNRISGLSSGETTGQTEFSSAEKALENIKSYIITRMEYLNKEI